MTIKKKASKAPIYIQTDIEDEIDKVIGRGGKTTADAEIETKQKTAVEDREDCYTLRMPHSLTKKIDAARKKMPGFVSRNQCILEALHKVYG